VDKERYLEIEHDIAERFDSPPIMISAAAGYHTEELKDTIYDCLGFMRVYLKPVGEEADLDEPLIVRRKSTVGDVCNKLHREFVQKFRYARIWGKSVKHPGQRVGLTHKLIDGDLLSIVVEH
jgi:hypothetical protein